MDDPVTRQELEQLFAALHSIEDIAHLLRELALDQLVAALGERPASFADLYDLAAVARVTPGHLEGVIERGTQAFASRRGGDAGD